MTWEGWTSMGVAVAVLATLALNVAAPDLVMVGALTVLLALGIVAPADALAGFGNEAVLTVAALFVVAAGFRETGGLDYVARRLLGRPRTVIGAQLRMMVPVAAMSAFLNNTPLVALMVPVVTDWAKRTGHSGGKLFIPLSYAAILGGTCTLIGTSTNLVVIGMARAAHPDLSIGIFDLSVVGIPTAIAGVLFIAATSRWLLPSRGESAESLDNPREYTVAMRLLAESPIVGQTIEEAGLRHLPGLYLVEIEREEEHIVAVGPGTRLRSDDILLFAGVVDSVVDLRKIRGLVPETDQVGKLLQSSVHRRLIEAVVAARSPLVDKTVRDSRFRTNYDAAIIAVHRQGERIRAKVGDIVLDAGDTLLLEAHPGFVRRHKNDASFALVHEVEGSAPPRHSRASIAAAIMVAMVAVNALGWMSLVTSAFIAVGSMIATRCITASEARRSVELPVLVAIAAAFGVGRALDESGAAHVIASALVDVAAPFGPVGVLGAVYVSTAFFTNIIGNNAAAALMYPVTAAAAEAAGIALAPALFVLMVAGSASFATPIGYQTNLMVLGPGRYRFSDFFRIGLPLQLVVGSVALTVVAYVWL